MSPYPPSGDLLFFLGDMLLGTTALAVILFTVTYMIGSDWRSTAAGRALGYVMMSFSAVLVLTFVSRLLGPDYTGREWFRLVVYVITTVAMWRLYILLLQTQWKHRDRK